MLSFRDPKIRFYINPIKGLFKRGPGLSGSYAVGYVSAC